jgi:hypothetical protein
MEGAKGGEYGKKCKTKIQAIPQQLDVWKGSWQRWREQDGGRREVRFVWPGTKNHLRLIVEVIR